MKIAIIINSSRMTPELEQKLKSDELSSKYDITYDLFISNPDNVESILNKIKLQSYHCCLIGGGDGTVRTAAQVLIDSHVPLAILPLGTFNLLAKTLNYPNDIEQVFSIIKNNKTKQIDLIEVNNTIVINHAWIGFYFYILKLRKKHRDIIGKNKLLKIIFNTISLFKILPIYNLSLNINNEQLNYQTCLIYIGNNEYNINLFDIGTRKTLSSGLLSVTILKCKSRWQLFLCMLNILFKQIDQSPYIERFATDELTISAQSNLINIVIDGELFKLKTPLHFINHHKKLTVVTD